MGGIRGESAAIMPPHGNRGGRGGMAAIMPPQGNRGVRRGISGNNAAVR